MVVTNEKNLFSSFIASFDEKLGSFHEKNLLNQ